MNRSASSRQRKRSTAFSVSALTTAKTADGRRSMVGAKLGSLLC
jgi:hypothetical protein